MNILVYLVPVFGALWGRAVGQPPETCHISVWCPRNPQGQCIDGNIPNPYDCHSFCACTNCMPVRLHCPEDLVYHPDVDRCVNQADYPGCQASIPFTTPRPAAVDVSTCAVFRQEHFGAADPLPFDYLLADFQNKYRTNHTIAIPSDGFYLNSISGATGQLIGLDLGLKRNGNKEVNLFRETPRTLGPDTSSRDFLSYYISGDELRISSETERVYSNGGHLTSWSVLGVTELMRTDILFSVTRLSSFTNGRLTFDEVLGNIGGGWNSSTNAFRAPWEGIYYFSLSTAVHTDQTVELVVYRGGDIELTGVSVLGRNTAGVTTVSRSFMLSLLEGDTIHIVASGSGFSNNMRLTSFSGLLYNPYHSTNVAWSVTDSRVRDITIRMDPMDFDTIVVNEGNAYDTANHFVSCANAGYYYIHLSFGSRAQSRTVMELIKNDVTQAHVTRDHEWEAAGTDTYSRSLILHCAAGERMAIAAQESSFDGTGQRVSFTGFFLYPA